MSTLKQKRVAKSMIENMSAKEPLTAGELLEKVGYATTVANHKPKEIFESKGVREELLKRGFNPETAKDVVGHILMDGENDNVKLKAADMVFKVGGTYAPEKQVNINLNGESTQRTRELGARLNKLLGRGDRPGV